MTMKRLIPLVLALGATSAGAQSIFNSALRTGPIFASYKVADPVGVTISELAIPVAVSMPFGSRVTFDVSSAYAMSQVKFLHAKTQKINGLTDTQLRANISLGQDFIIFTGGLNLPTGQTTVPDSQIEAAGYIANEFFSFPIPSMGTGFGGTGGVAIARPMGEWNVGFGGSVRYSAEYEPYKSGDTPIKFQPGNEYRLRLGVDHGFLGGRVAGGLTYSKFGEDAAGGSAVYSSGDRYVTEAGYARTLHGIDYTVSAWDIFRAEGIRADQRAPTENITTALFSAGFDVGGMRVEPNIETRAWYSEGTWLGKMATIGIRNRIALGGMDFFPSAAYAIGTTTAIDESTPSVTGFRASLTARFSR
jgi:hypothetical protein